MDGSLPPPKALHSPASHEDVASFFPEYVAEILAGGSPEARYPHVAAHLAVCQECSFDLDELLLLTMATYDDQDESPPERVVNETEAQPPSTILPIRLLPPDSPEPLGLWRRERQGVWVVTLSPALLTRDASTALAGMARGDDLLYEVLVQPEDGAPELRVEVYKAAGGDEVYLCLSVDTLDPDALDMGGVEVTATANGRVWSARTDGLGLASLRGIPRPALDGLELGVTVGRSA